MPKPKNTDLLSERKTIAAMLEDFDGATNADKLNAYMAQQKTVVDLLVEKNKALNGVQSSRLTSDTPEYEAGPEREVIKGKPAGPIDYAHYPKPGEQLPVPPASQMSAALGDMTPAYIHWFLSTNGPEATRAKYGERVIYLPEDVRRALA